MSAVASMGLNSENDTIKHTNINHSHSSNNITLNHNSNNNGNIVVAGLTFQTVFLRVGDSKEI
eukprot:Awhi_evm1s6138